MPLRKFPFSCWLPSLLSTGKGYWISYFCLTVAYFNIVNIHIAFDILLYGLLMINCTHIKLLKYRISKTTENIKKMSYSKYNNKNRTERYCLLKDCTKLQIFIYQLSEFAIQLLYNYNIIQ